MNQVTAKRITISWGRSEEGKKGNGGKNEREKFAMCSLSVAKQG